MKLFSIEFGHKAALTKFVSFLIYLFLFLKYTSNYYLLFIDDILSILYGLAWATCISGLLITNIFHKEIVKRSKIKRSTLIGIDIFGHILPLYLIYYYGPKKSRVNIWYLLIAIISFIILFGKYYKNVYIGVPPFILFILSPIIIIVSFYLRFF